MSKLKTHQKILLLVSLFLLYFNKLIPPMDGLNDMGHAILLIFLGSIIMLVGVNRSWGIPLCIIAFPLNDVYTLGQTIQLSFGNSTAVFCAFCTMLLFGLKETGVLRRIAILIISQPFTRKNPWLFLSALWGAALIMGCFINVTANTVLFLSLTIEIMESLGYTKKDRFAQVVMLGIMFFCALGFGVTPIGHPTVLTTISMMEELVHVSLLQYSLLGIGISIPIYILFILLMKYGYKLEAERISNFDPTSLREGLAPMSKTEKYSLITLATVTVLWILPDIVKPFSPVLYTFLNKMGVLTPAMLGVAALCLICVEGKPILDFYRAVREGTEWGAVFLMYISLFLASAVANKDAGIAAFVSAKLGPLLGGMSPFLLVFIVGMLCTALTNFMSCTLSVTIAGTIALTFINAGIVQGVNPGALCLTLGIVQAYAFMTPSAGTVAAVATGFGWTPANSMFKDGAIFSLIFGPLTIVAAYSLGCLVF